VEKLIPSLTHESDGLIFQGAEDPYRPGTFEDLLKWKFAHLNSVDLLLQVDAQVIRYFSFFFIFIVIK
jgi:mRNA-capping enzyme